MDNFIIAVACSVIVVLFARLLRVVRVVVWRPYWLTKWFENQGVTGPPYSLIYGSLREMRGMWKAAHQTILETNSHDIIGRVIPHYHKWFSQYGDTFLYWHGTQPRIAIKDPVLALQILSSYDVYVKSNSLPSFRRLAGNSLIVANGEDWERRRRTISPAFSMNNLKVMMREMGTVAKRMFDEWEEQANKTEDGIIKLEMTENLKKLTSDIIAHTAFGSSYAQGIEAFEAQKELQKYCFASLAEVRVPGSEYLPTPTNVQMWKLDRKVKKSIQSIIEKRMKTESMGVNGYYGDDLLGIMLGDTKTKNNIKYTIEDIIEECKTFFFAGQESTSSLLTWTIMLLSLYQEWQEKLREEVIKECGLGIPEASIFSKLKLMNMVVLEVLRLYPLATELFRKATEDVKLGGLMIPKDTQVVILMYFIHRSKAYWGEDADEFNPTRFINGVSKAAKQPNVLLPFGLGPRACVGQNFAMFEVKMVLALMLQRFSFSLSPDYKHTPMNHLTVQPQYGLPIIIKPL